MNIRIISGQNSIGDLGEHIGSPLQNPPAADALRELKQFFLSAACGFPADVFVGESGGDASSRCAVEVADLDEEWLVDIFNGILLLMKRDR